MNRPSTRNMEHTIAVRIDMLAKDLEFLINATPTSEKRNALTEANIHTMQLRDSFAKVRATNE